MQTIRIIAIILTCGFLASADGCDSANREQTLATEALTAEAHRQVGMPGITNFTERKLVKTVLELRDTEGLRTWTYVVDMHGAPHFLFESIGFGIPYGVQMTNPETYYISGATLPQAEPNGLFMPDNGGASWILAATPDGPMPVYVEPDVLVSPFKLPGVEHP